jgi:3D (Asp-Asp-Asp) domain-containing protein
MDEFFGPNLYLYVDNAPVNYFDPVGLYKWEDDNCTLVITKGDTLSGISQKTGIPIDELKKHFKDPSKIKIGDKIKLDGVSYSISIHFTGYCNCKECCLKEPTDPRYGICKDGTEACEGSLASDIKVIPMGATVTFTLNGKPFTGTVHDIGGAIKGKEIDVWCVEHVDAFKINFTATATVTIKCKK